MQQVRINKHTQLCAVTKGRHAANRVASARSNGIGIDSLALFCTGSGRQQLLVELVPTADVSQNQLEFVGI